MRRVLLTWGAAVMLAWFAGAASAVAQTYGTGYYRNDYFGSGYTGVYTYLGSTSFYDPATQGPYPYFGYGRPYSYSPAGPVYPTVPAYGFSGYGGYGAPCAGGLLPPSIMTP